MYEGIMNPLINSVYQGQEFWESRAKSQPFSSGFTDPTVEHLEWAALQRAIKTARIPHNKCEVLEIGCHIGYTSRKLFIHLCPERYDGLDAKHGCIQMANHYKQKYGFAKVNFFVASAADVPRLAGSYDTIFSIRCIQNIQDRDAQARTVEEIHRLLKPGGVAILAENWQEELDRLNRIRTSVNLEPMAAPEHTRFLKRSELELKVRNGFVSEYEVQFASAYYFGTRFAKWLDGNASATDLNDPSNRFWAERVQEGFRLPLGPTISVLRKRS